MPGLTKFFEKTHADPQKFWKEKKTQAIFANLT